MFQFRSCLFILTICVSVLHGQSPTAEALIAAGQKHAQKYDYVAAQRAFDQALPLVRQSGDEAALGRLLYEIGETYTARNYFRPAVDHYREAAPLLKNTGQNHTLGQCLEKMAGIQAEFGYSEAAIKHYQRALNVKSGLDDIAGVQYCHARLSRLYFADKNYEQALSHNEQALRLAQPDSPAETDAAIRQVIILTFLDRMPEAEQSLHRARQISNRRKDALSKVKLWTATFNFLLAQGRVEAAGIYIDSAKAVIKSSQNVELAIDALDQMAQIYQKNGDYQSAYDAMQSLDRYKDIFRNQNIARIGAEINDAAATALREKEIEFLQLNNQLNAAKLNRAQLLRAALQRENQYQDSTLARQTMLVAALTAETQLRNEQLEKEKSLNLALQRENELKRLNLRQERRFQKILWLGLSLLALSGSVILYMFRRQSRNNAIIRKQSDELTVLNKEVHHRVKNNLQVISSMLDLQSHSIRDPEAKTALKEAVLRVQAMAFIHQNLYQDDAANTVNMPDYIQMLSRHLFDAYNIHADDILLHLHIEPIRLHTESAIPVGMILNELIGNALKYAFQGRSSGQIWVYLQHIDGSIHLRVKDDGVGAPEGFDPEKVQSFGYEMILAFAKKLKAQLRVDGRQGLEVTLQINKFLLAPGGAQPDRL